LNATQKRVTEFDQSVNEGAVLFLGFEGAKLALYGKPDRTFQQTIVA
jgi:hypothetical protein